MHCVYTDIDCPYVNTSGMDKDKNCNVCEYHAPRIGLVILCTGKYSIFLNPLLDSAEEWFFKGENYDVYLFTDGPVTRIHDHRSTIFPIEVEHSPFPFIAMKRYKFISEYRDVFRAQNLMYIDVDMKFVGEVGAEILPDERGLVATRHPGFFKYGWGSRKTHVRSTAYVPEDKRIRYMCGAFEGGETKKFVEASETMWNNILEDFETAAKIGYTHNYGVLADFADETHWNAYLKGHPYKELSPSYCYPETWSIPFEKKILALKKNYREVR
jgi:hypothetical protein